MPSHRYVDLSSRGRIKGFSGKSKNGDLVGGAIPLLLKNIIKEPIKGGALQQDEGKANIMVGAITQVPTPKYSGGELLNSVSKLKFGKGMKRKSDQNIKFLF